MKLQNFTIVLSFVRMLFDKCCIHYLFNEVNYSMKILCLIKPWHLCTLASICLVNLIFPPPSRHQDPISKIPSYLGVNSNKSQPIKTSNINLYQRKLKPHIDGLPRLCNKIFRKLKVDLLIKDLCYISKSGRLLMLYFCQTFH